MISRQRYVAARLRDRIRVRETGIEILRSPARGEMSGHDQTRLMVRRILAFFAETTCSYSLQMGCRMVRGSHQHIRFRWSPRTNLTMPAAIPKTESDGSAWRMPVTRCITGASADACWSAPVLCTSAMRVGVLFSHLVSLRL